jgi:hypothetical protein
MYIDKTYILQLTSFKIKLVLWKYKMDEGALNRIQKSQCGHFGVNHFSMNPFRRAFNSFRLILFNLIFIINVLYVNIVYDSKHAT